MKKLIAIILAAMMVCTLCVTAFAAPADLTGHTYTAYQIFSGTQNETDPDLSDIAWGADIDEVTLLAALKASEEFGTPNPFADCDTAYDVACAMEGWTDGSAKAKAFAKTAYDHIIGEGIAVENGETEINAGYYLICDTTEDADILNLALLQQTQKGTFEIATKVDVPEVTKKLSDASGLICTDKTEGHVHTKACYNWTDADKVAIGDTVLFDVTSAVPAAAADYDYYYFIICDTLSDGLTYTNGSISVTIGGEPAAEGTDYSVKFNADDKTFELALHDAKANAGKSVEVMYAATLNEDAVIGIEGNPNEVTVMFSNNPNFKYDGTQNPDEEPYEPENPGTPQNLDEPHPDTPDDEDKPGFPKPEETGNVPTGETPKDITLTYTTALKLYKVDQDGNPLEGAEFTLTGEGLNIVLIARDSFTVNANGTYWKLANGSYTKTPPITEDSMDPAQPGATKTYVVTENGYTGEAVIVGGITYRPYKASTDSAKQQYTLTRNNVALYDSITTKYSKTIVMEQKVITAGINVSAEVDELGIVYLQGLNAGTYTLSETTVPDGYNPIDDITFTVDCELPEEVITGEEECKWTVTCDDANISYSEENDAFEMTVVNQKGSVLPETGGIGTTIFYVLGAMMAVTAVVLLVAKKRFSAEA